ncbi:MAG: Cache 3/Cache 2 fusion domain-containing protein, partial [Clostridia bacterium]|nr:Cache 3/Cache 2 fusion domain-containing protein [Clostridia bacterium]
MKKGLAQRLALKVGVVTVVIFAAALIILALVLHSQVVDSSNEKIQLMADKVALETEEFFTQHRGATEQTAVNPTVINFMKAMRANPVPYGESPLFPEVQRQLAGAYSTHSDTATEIYIGDWFAKDIGSSNGEIMSIDYPGLDTTTRIWLKGPKETGGTIFTAPFIDASFKIPVCTIASPVKDSDGSVLGSVCIGFGLTTIQENLANTKVGEEGYVMVFLDDGTVFYHHNEDFMKTDADGNNLNVADLGIDDRLVEAVMAHETGTLFNFEDENGVNMTAVTEILDGAGWNVVVALPESEAYAMATNTILFSTAILLFALIIILAALLVITKKAIKPITVVASQAADLAHGRKADGITKRDVENDEIDMLVNSFAALVDSTAEQAHALDEVAAGNTNIEINVRSEEDVLNISMKKMVETISDLIGETENLTQNAILGNTSYRGDASRFVGGYRRIVEGFNSTMEAVMKEINVVADVSAALGRGEVPEINNNSQGDYAEIMNALQGAVDNIKTLVEDTQKVAAGAADEDYSVRADASQYGGAFKSAVEGINHTLELMADKKLWYETMLNGVPVMLQTV